MDRDRRPYGGKNVSHHQVKRFALLKYTDSMYTLSSSLLHSALVISLIIYIFWMFLSSITSDLVFMTVAINTTNFFSHSSCRPKLKYMLGLFITHPPARPIVAGTA